MVIFCQTQSGMHTRNLADDTAKRLKLRHAPATMGKTTALSGLPLFHYVLPLHHVSEKRGARR